MPVHGGTLASKAEAATGRSVLLNGTARAIYEGALLCHTGHSYPHFSCPFAIIPSVAGEVRLVLRRLARPSWGSSGADLKFCQSAAAVHAGSCIHQLVRG